MRFDDSLRTVLSSDMEPGMGAQSAWRQLVDLAGRGRAPADEPVLARLRMLRSSVPAAVRAASARALALASPDAQLVALFAEDDLAIAAPLVRTAVLDGQDWIALLPRLSPALRAVLRQRRDLPADVTRGLESFGPIDFVLPGPSVPPEPVESQVEPVPAAAPAAPPADAPRSPSPFVTLGEVARGLPVVAEALARAEPAQPQASPAPPPETYPIPELVARIEAFRRTRETGADRTAPIPIPPPIPAAREAVPASFQYRTDAAGTIVAVDGVAPGALVGLSIAHAAVQGPAQVDGTAAGGFRRRSRFAGARLEVGGTSSAAGSWRLTGVPGFDPATGRFTGFLGAGRRPRADESAAPRPASPSPDALRQLVHELRTPANAIAGFAELMETELLGPLAETYRKRAGLIRSRAGGLIEAIDDLDTAARIEVGALDLRAEPVAAAPLLERTVQDLMPLAALRRVSVLLAPIDPRTRMLADGRAVERLVARLLATVVAAAGSGERLTIRVTEEGDLAALVVDRPRALAGLDADALFGLDGEGADEDGDEGGAPLLGTGFALRLARNLATELGGSLTFGADRLTLRLPAAVDRGVEHATTL